MYVCLSVFGSILVMPMVSGYLCVWGRRGMCGVARLSCICERTDPKIYISGAHKLINLTRTFIIP